MKKHKLSLTLAIFILGHGNLIAEGTDLQKPTFPEPLVKERIKEETPKSHLYDILKGIQAKKEDSFGIKGVLPLAKAFLNYRLENFEDAIKLASAAETDELADLRLFIIADSERLLADSDSKAKDASLRLKLLENSAKGLEQILIDYRKSPLLEPAKASLLKGMISRAGLLYETGDHKRSFDLYMNILVNYRKDLQTEEVGKVIAKIGDYYYSQKETEEATRAYTEAKKYLSETSLIDSRLSSLAVKSSSEAQVGTRPEKTKSEPLNPEERDTYDTAVSLFEKNHLEKAMDRFAHLAKTYPGSSYLPRAREIILKIVRLIVDEKKESVPWGKHFETAILPGQIAGSLSRMDLETRIVASSLLYRSEFLKDVRVLLSSVIKDYRGSDFIPRALLIQARIERVLGNLSEARALLKLIYTGYSSSGLAHQALFKSGLLDFETKKYNEARSIFKRYLSVANSEERAQALYWLAKSCEELKDSNCATESISELRTESPISFYAVTEGSLSHLLNLAEKDETLKGNSLQKSPAYFSIEDIYHIRRALGFISLGLMDYSQYEIRQVSTGGKPEAEAYLGLLLSRAGLHRDAIGKAANAVVSRPGLIDKNMLDILFPKEYMHELINNAELYGVDHLLLLSLIKQESAFDDSAVSRSGALGLMQLMPFTADEVSTRLFAGTKVPRENINEPALNIGLGTFYFHHLLKIFRGNVYRALAAYNAGPSRCDEWINQYKGLSDIEFVEEIPVDETNGYVKNIARNYIFYSYLSDRKSVTTEDLKNGKFFDSAMIKSK